VINRRALAVLPILLLLTGCGGAATPVAATTPQPTATLPETSPAQWSPAGQAGNGSASPSPVRLPTPSPQPAGPYYGVLVDLLTAPSTYIANVVALNGSLWASIRLDKRTPISNPKGHAVVLPYVSTSKTALYMLAGDTDVLTLRLPDGKQAAVTHLAVGANMEAAFAVSPDDSQIAVSVLDFGRTPVHVTLYTESLTGANHRVIYESDSNYVWPVAWHGGLLVLAHAYGPFEEDIARAAPGRDNPYSAISYHIVDPATANRVYLLGACTVSGLLSPAGSGCIQGGTIDWQGNTSASWSTNDWGSVSSAASLSPDGLWVAATIPDSPDKMGIWAPDGRVVNYVYSAGIRDWAGWLDDQHILAGSYLNPTFQPVVTNPIKGGIEHPVAAYGFYAARLPTDIA
jgi:hypothetical protein